MGRADPEPFPQDLGGGDHQGVQLALGVAGGLDRGAAGRQPHRQGGSWTGRSGLGELITAEGLAGGPDRVQRIRLGAMAAGSPRGPIQLHNLFLVGSQEPGQPGAVAAGALDRPHPLAVVLVGELESSW